MNVSTSPEKTTTRTVWKYRVPLGDGDVFEIMIPAHADALTVQMQDGKPQMWALVDPNLPTWPYRFRIAGTGHPIEERIKKYVGSFQLYAGALVFHIFEVES